MFFHLGRRRTSSSASGNTGKRPPEEQFDEEEEKSFDPLSYRLQHLNQQGCSSSSGMNRHDVDPFDVGSSAGSSSSDDQSEVMEVGVVKMGAVDDVMAVTITMTTIVITTKMNYL